MNKSDDRRALILDRLADHILAHGLIASSLRPLAKAAGTSDRMLLYYFADKAELIGAALETIAARTVGLLMARAAPHPLPYDALLQQLGTLLDDEELWPYLRVYLEMASRSANGDPLYREIGERIGRGFYAWGMSQLESNTPEQDAARLLVATEGMIFLKAIGLGDISKAALAQMPI
jgi:AcrR family transcriptional regulator